MEGGGEFIVAALAVDSRVPRCSVGSVVVFAPDCHGRHIGALIGLDRLPSMLDPRLPARILRAVRGLIEPAAVALGNALLLERAEAR